MTVYPDPTGARPRAAVSVVTLVRNRLPHLANQAASLAPQLHEGDDYIVVQMGGADPSPVLATRSTEATVRVVALNVGAGEPLPLARARNAGAAEADNDRLVFLDVDCIASPELIPGYVAALDETACAALVSGPVGYLGPDTELDADAQPQPHLHPADRIDFPLHRPQPGASMQTDIDPALFWSLSFACHRTTWHRIGGFDERYVGYGGEDTDFGLRAHAAGIPLVYIGNAVSYHQHHPTSSPPWPHLDDICRNAVLFRQRWGRWPMEGWLGAFAAAGAIRWDPDSETIERRRPTAPMQAGRMP